MRRRLIQVPVLAWLTLWFGWVVPTHDCRHWRLVDDGQSGCGIAVAAVTHLGYAGCGHANSEPRPGDERDGGGGHDHGRCVIHLLSAGADAPRLDAGPSADATPPQRLGRLADARWEKLAVDPLLRGRAPPIA